MDLGKVGFRESSPATLGPSTGLISSFSVVSFLGPLNQPVSDVEYSLMFSLPDKLSLEDGTVERKGRWEGEF